MKNYSRLSLAILIELGLSASLLSSSAWAAETSSSKTSASTTDAQSMDGGTLMVTAQQQNLQAPGVSTITADEIKKHPPARD
ncbi:TonB-dependent siderophore receptor, partial [Pantoea endophytica]